AVDRVSKDPLGALADILVAAREPSVTADRVDRDRALGRLLEPGEPGAFPQRTRKERLLRREAHARREALPAREDRFRHALVLDPPRRAKRRDAKLGRSETRGDDIDEDIEIIGARCSMPSENADRADAGGEGGFA